MARIARVGPSALLLLASIGLGPGCGTGGAHGPAEEVFHHAALGEVGGLHETYLVDAKKPPRSLADFARYEPGLPTGFLELKSGNVVTLWGVPLSAEATDKVLAYEKATPASGGFVLMQDGKTVKKMTAEEFKAAPKAGEIPPAKAP